jgi:hypothetical protein
MYLFKHVCGAGTGFGGIIAIIIVPAVPFKSAQKNPGQH